MWHLFKILLGPYLLKMIIIYTRINILSYVFIINEAP